MHHVALALYPGFQVLNLAVSTVLEFANRSLGEPLYQVHLLSEHGGPVLSSGGFFVSTEPFGKRRFDTVLVVGDNDVLPTPPALVKFLQRAARTSRRIGATCTGAFNLAEAGVLDGRRATTHWSAADALAARYPKVTVDADAIHVRDGKVRTAAGVTAGMDLALALVEEDLGRDIALKVASQLVMFFKRPGGQGQFSRRAAPAAANRSALQELQRWVAAHPAAAHDVPSLAARIGVSARHLSRLFQEEVGVTPANWVEAARVTAARQLLEEGNIAPKQAAAECGFSSVDTLRRAFLRVVGVTPAEYRKRFVSGVE